MIVFRVRDTENVHVMRIIIPAIALVLACAQANAVAGGKIEAGRNIAIDGDCSVHSDYAFNLTERSVIFTRDDDSREGAPSRVLMRQGLLFVEDHWVKLTPKDSERIRTYERQARSAMPLAQQIGRDAAQIAFTAIGEVAAGFSGHPAQTRASLARARARLDARLARSVTATRFSGDELGKGIGEAVREVLPSVMGDVVGGAVRAAFTGDIARLQRMQDLDQEIERRIAPRAKALERNVDLLCLRMESLDRIDDALDYRLPDGSTLDLLQVERKDKHDRS